MKNLAVDLEEWDDDPQRPRNRREQWTDLILADHTGSQWTAITTAIRIADAGEPARGGPRWCELALSAAAHPAANPPSQPDPAGAPARYVIDEDVVRTWLMAPAPVQLDPNGTVADRLGLVDWWRAGDIDAHKAATMLLNNAQLSGIVALPGHHAVLLRIVDALDDEPSYVLALLRDTGPSLLCNDDDVGHLIPYTARTQIDGAVHLLVTAARIANATLDQLVAPTRTPAFPGRHAAPEHDGGPR